MNERHKILRLKYWKLFLKFPSPQPSDRTLLICSFFTPQPTTRSEVMQGRDAGVENFPDRCGCWNTCCEVQNFWSPNCSFRSKILPMLHFFLACVGPCHKIVSLTFFGSLGSDWWMVWRPRATSSRTPFLIGTASVERSPTGMGNGDWCGRNSDQNKCHEAKVVVSWIL